MESKWGRMPASAHMLVDARMQALEGALAQTDGARVLAHMCRAWTDEFTSTPRVFDPDPAGRRGNNPPPECDYGTANKQPQPIQNLTRDARVWFIRRNEGESTYDNVFCFLYDSGALWFPVPGIEDGVIPNDDHDHAVVCVVPSIAPAVASKDIIGTLPVFDMDHADGLKGGKRTLALAAAINSILLVNSYLQENDEKFHQLFFYVDAQDSWTTFVEPLTKNSYQGRALSAIIEHEDALTADYKSDTKVKRGRDVLMASVLDLLWTMKCEPHTHAVHHVAIAFIKFSLYSCLPKGKLGMHMTQTAFLDMDCAWDTNDGTRARRQAEKLINATREGMPLDNDVAETKIITKAKKLSDAGTKVVHILEEYMPDFVDKDLGTPKQVDVVQAGALAGVAPDNVYHAICEHQTDAAGMSKNSTASFLGTMVHLAYDTAPACFNDTETPALVARAVAVTRPLSAVCVVAGIALRDHAEASGVPKGGVPGGWALVAVLRTPRTQSLFAGMFTPPPKELHAEYTSTKAAMALADSEVTDENEIHSVELKSIWRAAGFASKSEKRKHRAQAYIQAMAKNAKHAWLISVVVPYVARPSHLVVSAEESVLQETRLAAEGPISDDEDWDSHAESGLARVFRALADRRRLTNKGRVSGLVLPHPKVQNGKGGAIAALIHTATYTETPARSLHGLTAALAVVPASTREGRMPRLHPWGARGTNTAQASIAFRPREQSAVLAPVRAARAPFMGLTSPRDDWVEQHVRALLERR